MKGSYNMSSIHILFDDGRKLLLENFVHIAEAGRHEYAPGTVRNIHHHPDCLEMLFIESGTGSAYIDNNNYPFHEGQVVIYNPAVFHREVILSSSKPSVLYYLKLTKFRINGLPDNCLLPAGSSPILETADIAGILQPLFAYLALSRELSENQTVKTACILLLMLSDLIANRGAPEAVITEGSLFKAIRSYIEQNYASEIKLKDIAAELHINNCYLSHLFKEKMGITPQEYITRLRINEAAHLLADTDLSIGSIGLQVGYSTASHFYTSFKRTMGVTPSEYRKRALSTKPADRPDTAEDYRAQGNWRSYIDTSK